MKKNGFTFIELSLVMVIIAILVAGSMPIGASIIRAGKIQTTTQKLDAIEAALEAYLVTNGTLPCPASREEVPGDANFGIEARTSATECNTGYSGITYDGTNDILHGAVPVRTLNMTNLSMSDGWDNKIAYIVAEDFAENFTIQPSDSDTITITTGTTPDTITDDAIYVLISPGKNRSGAYPIDAATQINTSPPNSGEDENIDEDPTFRDYEYDEDFDDGVRFKTKMQIVFDIDWEDIGCSGAEATALYSYSWPDAKYGEGVESTSDSGYCRKCYKYSRWGNEYTTDCP
ncbi:type II secretion system protein [Pseudomonadota bacterium]